MSIIIKKNRKIQEKCYIGMFVHKGILNKIVIVQRLCRKTNWGCNASVRDVHRCDGHTFNSVI